MEEDHHCNQEANPLKLSWVGGVWGTWGGQKCFVSKMFLTQLKTVKEDMNFLPEEGARGQKRLLTSQKFINETLSTKLYRQNFVGKTLPTNLINTRPARLF